MIRVVSAEEAVGIAIVGLCEHHRTSHSRNHILVANRSLLVRCMR